MADRYAPPAADPVVPRPRPGRGRRGGHRRDRRARRRRVRGRRPADLRRHLPAHCGVRQHGWHQVQRRRAARRRRRRPGHRHPPRLRARPGDPHPRDRPRRRDRPGGHAPRSASATLLGGYYVRLAGPVTEPFLEDLDGDDPAAASRSTAPADRSRWSSTLSDTTTAIQAIDIDAVNQVIADLAGATDRNRDIVPRVIENLTTIGAAISSRDAELGRLIDQRRSRSPATLAERDDQILQLIDAAAVLLDHAGGAARRAGHRARATAAPPSSSSPTPSPSTGRRSTPCSPTSMSSSTGVEPQHVGDQHVARVRRPAVRAAGGDGRRARAASTSPSRASSCPSTSSAACSASSSRRPAP